MGCCDERNSMHLKSSQHLEPDGPASADHNFVIPPVLVQCLFHFTTKTAKRWSCSKMKLGFSRATEFALQLALSGNCEVVASPAPELLEDSHVNLQHRLWLGWLEIRATEPTSLHLINLTFSCQRRRRLGKRMVFILPIFTRPCLSATQNNKTLDVLEWLCDIAPCQIFNFPPPASCQI